MKMGLLQLEESEERSQDFGFGNYRLSLQSEDARGSIAREALAAADFEILNTNKYLSGMLPTVNDED